MRFVRFVTEGVARWGIPIEGAVQVIDGDPVSGYRPTRETLPALSITKWLPPALPSKIVAIGLNFRDHAVESNKDVPAEPLMFLKPPSSLIGHGQPIRIPRDGDRVDHEAELAVVMGRRSYCLTASDWRDAVLGYTCANDVSNRVLQRRDGQFTRGKGFDTFCPLGRELSTDVDPSSLNISCQVNGNLRQHSSTDQFIFDVGAVLEFASKVMTLEPWDVVLMGTPAGVAPLSPGDVVEVAIEGVGTLESPVIGY